MNCAENIGICRVELEEELYDPDEYTKRQLIRKLVYRDSENTFNNCMSEKRRAIPAFKKYSKLAVTRKDTQFIGLDENSKWIIISPITKDDFEEIQKFTKDLFIEFVVSKPTFCNLVRHVLEHGKTKSEESDIINEYKCLIGEFYDIECIGRA